LIREWKSGCPEWVSEQDSPRAERQRTQARNRIVDVDHKHLPTSQLVKDWHRLMFDGLAPHPDYPGNFRDVDEVPYCLQRYDIQIDSHYGVHHTQVLQVVEEFIGEFTSSVEALDAHWSTNEDKPSVSDVNLVVGLAAWAHGEWVRLHPFANGNGRTARLWANYVFVRYGFGPVVAVRPRPENPYGLAA